MRRVIIDIETVGKDFELFDEITKKEILSKITFEKGTPQYEEQLAVLTQELQFSPLMGEVIVIGAYDVEKQTGVISYQSPGTDVEEITEDNITYKARSEKSILEAFWGGIVQYDECITFNGRGFDIPYLIARSGVQKVHVTRDLMSNRYNNRSWGGMLHIDLYDQLKYYGSVQRAGSLHLWTQAMGIESPKGGSVAGKDVGKAFADGRALEIAQYNARDLIATAELYNRWKEYMQP
ncbi:MAG: ribonuclease H-like domain-containing protein [Patescibacteria group bacterium]|mgnify:CR=1 FL=1